MSTDATPREVGSNDGLGVGALTLQNLDGHEVSPGITLIGEPTPVVGTDKLRCLANVGGALGVVELRVRFLTPNVGGEARLAAHQPSHTTTATPQGVASTDQLGRASEARK